MLPLVFSFATMISDALTVLTSLINFIQDNTLLISLLGIVVAIPLVFSIISYIRSKVG